MSMFDDPTPIPESPEIGHEEEMAESENEETTEEVIETVDEEQTEENEDTTETESEDSQEEHSEELLAGKYKTPQDLEKAYKSLLGDYTKKSQQLKQTQQERTPQLEQMGDDFWDAFQQDPRGTLSQLIHEQAQQLVQEQVSPLREFHDSQKFTNAFDPIARQYRPQLSQEGGMEMLANKVREICEELGNPELARNPSPRIWQMATAELWGDSTAAVVQKAREDERRNMEESRRTKKVANVPVGKKAQQPQKTEDDLIRESILSAGSGGFFG